MQHFTREHVTADGIDLAWAAAGDGPPVVYIHGALGVLEEGMIALLPTLEARYRLIAFDRPGHGESGGDMTTGSAIRQAELIHGALEQMGVERPVIVGHSFGGAVAMAIALRFPEALSGVVAIAPIAFPEPRAEMLLFGPRAAPISGPWLTFLSAPLDAVLLPMLWEGMFLPQAMTPEFRNAFPFGLASGRAQVRADGQDAASMVTSIGRMAMRYGLCQTPVRILQGDQDIVVNPLIHGPALAAVLPNGQITSVAGQGHMLHHFHPELVAGAIDELVAAERASSTGQGAAAA